MILLLNSSKLRQSAQPPSATVGTPARKVKPIRVNAMVARVRPALAGAREYVNVDIDQPRRDVQSRHVDRLHRLRRIDMLLDRGHFAILDGDIADGVDP